MIFDNLWLSIALVPGVLASQPSAPEPVEAPLRKLPWGQLNWLATTDTHGWVRITYYFMYSNMLTLLFPARRSSARVSSSRLCSRCGLTW